MVKKNLLQELINRSGPSGFEKPIRDFILQAIKPYVDEVSIDKFGNLLAHKKGKSPTVMLAAHMDEVGLLIHNITPEGHLLITSVGSIEPITLVGERVVIKTKKGLIRGVITTKEIHEGEEITALPTYKDLYIDAGIKRKELQRKGVEVGTYVHLASTMSFLGSEDIISGKALDDRLGCFVLIEVAKRLSKIPTCSIYYVFTVQEEIGLYGSKTSIYSIDPDWALVVDITNTDDSDFGKVTKQIGMGPCITIKDADMIGNRCINDIFKAVAKKYKIPIQLEITDYGSTDALSISVAKGGIPTGMLGVPIRNIHTTHGIASMTDINNSIKLVVELLKKPPHVCLV